MKRIIMSKTVFVGLICVSLLGLIPIASLSCASAPVKAPYELVPENADLLAYIQLDKVLNDPDFQDLYKHIYQAIPEQQRPSGLPRTLENASEMFKAQTGLDLNDFSEIWAFVDVDYLLEGGYYWGLIIKGDFLKYKLLLMVGKLTNIGGISVTQYKDYEIYTRQQEDVGITFLETNTVIIAPIHVIEDVIDVEKGEGSPVSGQLYDTFTYLPTGSLCKCALRLSDTTKNKIEEMLATTGIPVDLTPITEINALGAAVCKEEKIIQGQLRTSFDTEDTAQNFANMLENLVLTAKGIARMIDIPELEAVLDKVNVNQSNQQVIIESRVLINEVEALIDAIPEIVKGVTYLSPELLSPAPTPAPVPPMPAPPTPPPEPAFIIVSEPSGPSTGEVNQTLTFSTSASSNIAGSPEYQFLWGDGSYSDWSSSATASHAWAFPGRYTIRAEARCGNITSDWSSGKTITIEPESLSRQPEGQPEAMMSYITPEDPQIRIAVEDILSGSWRWAYNDFNALREWVSTHVSYVYDQSVHGTSEYWQLPAETLNLGTGDCEDFAILLCTLLRAYGVPSDQVYVVCAYSEGAEHGHAFLFERWYKGIWRAIEPQAGVWHVFAIGDIDPSEYDRFYCFNDQGYLTDKPALSQGEYEFEVDYSFWPATRGATVEFERYLNAGERVSGSIEWGKDLLGELSDIVYDWTITAYDQHTNVVFSCNGTDLSHDFSFTASQSGSYRIEILKRDYLSRCAKMTIEPADWAQQ